jgi:outer membrane cobalamin receptor
VNKPENLPSFMFYARASGEGQGITLKYMPYLLFYKRGLRLLVCLYLALPACVWGQEDSVLYRELPLVEVIEKARPSLMREAAPLQALDQGAILRLGIYDLPEAVRRFSGVELRDYGGIGGLKTVSVRGLGAQHTAVSYDGVTVTDAQSGQVDIGRFSLDRVESVTLSMGQTGDIFRTARLYASAGALSISTQRPQLDGRPFRVEGQVRAGSFGYLSPSARYEQRLGEGWDLSLNLSHLSAEGDYPYTFTNGSIVSRERRKNSDIGSTSAELNVFGGSDSWGKLHVKAYGFDSRRGLPGSVILYNDYHTERLANRNAFAQGVYELPVKGRLSVKGLGKFDYSWTRYSDFHSKYVGGEQSDVYTQREYYASVVALYDMGDLSMSAAQDGFYNTLDATTPLCAFPRRFTSLSSLNVQLKKSRLTVTAGILGSYVTEQVSRGKAAGDRHRLSPSVAVSYRIIPVYNLRLRASYKDVLRLPTFNDLYYDRIGNKDLSPEKAAQYNAGITWSGSFGLVDYLSLTADAYYNKVKDKIVAMPTMFIWKMMNMGEVDIRGVDVNLAMRFEAAYIAVRIDGSYSRRKAIDVTRKESKTYGHQIPYTPLESGSASVSIESRWVNVGWTLGLTGSRYVLPQNMEANRIDGYAEQQVSLNRTFTLLNGKLRLQAEVLNLLDVNYDVIRYYPMPGRSFRMSIRYSY